MFWKKKTEWTHEEAEIVGVEPRLRTFQYYRSDRVAELFDGWNLTVRVLFGDGTSADLERPVDKSVAGWEKDEPPPADDPVFKPGDKVPILRDPAERSHVELDNEALRARLAPSEYEVLDDAGAKQIAKAAAKDLGSVQHDSSAALLATGQRTTAVVREFSASGKTVGDVAPNEFDPNDPLYVFKLELAKEGGGRPIKATTMNRVPEAKVGMLMKGLRLNVAYNPANPKREVAIDWATPPPD